LGTGALKGGMPLYKYFFNRILTMCQNLLIGYKLSEYHTGYRAFNSHVLNSIAFKNNSDDFVFDNQMLSQIIYKGFDIAEVSCPTKYFEEASSINFKRSVKYGLGVYSVYPVNTFCKRQVYSNLKFTNNKLFFNILNVPKVENYLISRSKNKKKSPTFVGD
jgi:hypothetical protein